MHECVTGSGIAGYDVSCCLHTLPKDDPRTPGRVCCWCGYDYLSHDEIKHGQFKPKQTPQTP